MGLSEPQSLKRSNICAPGVKNIMVSLSSLHTVTDFTESQRSQKRKRKTHRQPQEKRATKTAFKKAPFGRNCTTRKTKAQVAKLMASQKKKTRRKGLSMQKGVLSKQFIRDFITCRSLKVVEIHTGKPPPPLCRKCAKAIHSQGTRVLGEKRQHTSFFPPIFSFPMEQSQIAF